MGLGKTLQALCVVTEHALDLSPRKAKILVICPASLIYVWSLEINKFGFDKILDVFADANQFIAAPDTSHKVLVISYRSSALQSDRLSSLVWDYLVLDEAHFVRNPNTQTFLNIKLVKANHTLALSGTPLQNRVTDLWALFDILNPGLIEENAKTFRSKFERPLKGSLRSLAENKNLAKKQTFVKALKELQNRVAPFILRRVKEDVLGDLPPRILEDYFCTPSQSQIEAIERAEEDGGLSLEDVAEQKLGEGVKGKREVGILKSLLTHRKLASHPNLACWKQR